MTTPHSTRPGEPGRPGQARPGNRATPRRRSPGQARSERATRQVLSQTGPGSGPTSPGVPGLPSWPLAFGAIAVGVMLLVWPKATLAIVAVLIGISLIVAGLLRLIDGFTAHDASGGKRVAHVLIGLLAIIVGLYCIRHYNVTIAVLAIIVGLFWVLHGIADIAVGLFGGPYPGRGLTVAGRASSA